MSPTTAGWRQRALAWVGWVGLALNLGVLVGLTAWAWLDGRFPAAADTLAREGLPEFGASGPTAPRVLALAIGLALASLSAAWMLVGLSAGTKRQRGLGAWLVATTLTAFWLTLWIAWPEVAWRGQRHRLAGRATALEPLAESLLAEWPTADGDSQQLGAYMAYPQGAPPHADDPVAGRRPGRRPRRGQRRAARRSDRLLPAGRVRGGRLARLERRTG